MSKWSRSAYSSHRVWATQWGDSGAPGERGVHASATCAHGLRRGRMQHAPPSLMLHLLRPHLLRPHLLLTYSGYTDSGHTYAALRG